MRPVLHHGWRLAPSVLFLALPLLPASPAHAQPDWWLGLGAQLNVDVDGLGEVRGTEAGVVLGGGVHLWRLGAVLTGAEAEGSAGRVSEDLGATSDRVDIWRGRVGLRLTWWVEHDAPIIVPYLRGGGVYRADRRELRDDDGLGWYGGGGVDLMLSERWGLGLGVTYERVALRRTARNLLLSLGLTYHFY